ncbi:hypothetical protein KXD93_25485 [Mucilaginibacter sp. BJC16-A38]|uniref:hypothetical protein n=1 Tax=Mucilaginibacter phenanthrenivorans TaxID=1234842 RepID=UPI0021575834|nr:hypothetical protein [Mucilaginibacter phenanthrenivorans]MCR8561035.1 hypothetical protein [Mucilaginibacter phenanthrenivorans]
MDKKKFDFSENYRTIGNEHQPLTKNTVQDYITKHGKECGEGYLTAVKDFIEEMYFVLEEKISEGQYKDRAPQRSVDMICNLLSHKKAILKAVNNKSIDNPEPPKSNGPIQS